MLTFTIAALLFARAVNTIEAEKTIAAPVEYHNPPPAIPIPTSMSP